MRAEDPYYGDPIDKTSYKCQLFYTKTADIPLTDWDPSPYHYIGEPHAISANGEQFTDLPDRVNKATAGNTVTTSSSKFACAGWMAAGGHTGEISAPAGGLTCTPLPTGNTTCTATDLVINHGDISPSVYDGNQAKGVTTVQCDGAADVVLSFSSDSINLSNDTISTVTFSDSNSSTLNTSLLENVASSIEITSTLAGTPSPGAFEGSTTLIITVQ
jgi:hypothetical protein